MAFIPTVPYLRIRNDPETTTWGARWNFLNDEEDHIMAKKNKDHAQDTILSFSVRDEKSRRIELAYDGSVGDAAVFIDGKEVLRMPYRRWEYLCDQMDNAADTVHTDAGHDDE
jgi:hypothetical protein